MTEPTERLTGYDLLHTPRLNKGTAFTEAERRTYGLEGLLPPAVTNVELQVARRHAEIAAAVDAMMQSASLRPAVEGAVVARLARGQDERRDAAARKAAATRSTDSRLMCGPMGRLSTESAIASASGNDPRGRPRSA